MGELQLAQLQVGDCLAGSNMQLNTSAPWPKVTKAVPCTEDHTAEVFYASDNYWAKKGALSRQRRHQEGRHRRVQRRVRVLRGHRVLQVALHLDRLAAGRVYLAERRPGPALRRLLRHAARSRPG